MQNQDKITNKLPKKENNVKSKIPSILQKNANRTIESITFQVEKGLKPIGDSLYSLNIKYIFNGLFQKRKKE